MSLVSEVSFQKCGDANVSDGGLALFLPRNDLVNNNSSIAQAFAKALQRKIGQIDGQLIVKHGLT